MNFVDMILFNAVHSPEKMAMAGEQSALSYGQLGHGILAAQRKLESLGLARGSLAGVSIAHPIDHLVLSCALYRIGVGSVPVETLLNVAEPPTLGLILSDRILPPDMLKRVPATILLFDPSWFKEQTNVTLGVRAAEATTGDWIARAFADQDNPSAPLVRLTAAALEAQLGHYYLSALPRWDRMVTTLSVNTNPGYLLALMALWLGRTVCFASPNSARELIILHGHDYLVTSLRHTEIMHTLQREAYRSIQSIRGAFIHGPGFTQAAVGRAQYALCGNIICGLATPANGVVAFAPADNFTREDAAAGRVAPWAEVAITDTVGQPMPAGERGDVRVRMQAGTSAEWERAGSSGHVRSDGMLQIG